MENTDVVIIQKCLNGNTEAFSELVTRYKNLIYGLAYRLTDDTQEANDLSQDAFLRIFKSLAQYNKQYKFSTWAGKITTNLYLDRRKQKKALTLPLEEAQEIAGSFHIPESEYLKKELKSRVKNALDELPEKYRKPLILFHQAGMSYEEITQILKEPMTIIKNRLYRARLMLREKLASERKEGSL